MGMEMEGLLLGAMFAMFIEAGGKVLKNRREDEDERWNAWKAGL